MSNEKSPVISIITVVFNGAKTLQATIESVIPQLGRDVEYIIVDGGSTDGTQEIIRSYADYLAYWVSEPDQGIYDAWNKALAQSSGQYIGFVGADDVLFPEALSSYMSHIQKRPDIEYWSSRIAFGSIEGRVLGQPWRWKEFRRYMKVAHVGSLHHRDLYKRYGLYDTTYRIAGDYEFLLRTGASLKSGFVDMVSAMMGDGGVSNKSVSLALSETAKAKRAHKAVPVWVVKFDLLLAKAKHAVRMLFSQQ